MQSLARLAIRKSCLSTSSRALFQSAPRCLASKAPSTSSRSRAPTIPIALPILTTQKAEKLVVPIRRVRRNKRTAVHIQEFFSGYPSFNYDSLCPVMSEFWRMCRHFHWGEKDEERQAAHEKLKDAMVKQFNNYYGTDIGDINSWQILCGVLGISPIPQELNACREVVKKTHVNLVDLVDNSGDVVIFKSLEDLRSYTIATGKYFPKENAYEGGVLKHLLREIHNSWEGRRRESRGRDRPRRDARV